MISVIIFYKEKQMLVNFTTHEAYKDGKYTQEPSSIFLYIEKNENFAGFHCYFMNSYKEFKNAALIKDLEYSKENFAKKEINEKFIKEMLLYIKAISDKWKKNISKVLFFENEKKYLIYDI